MPEPEYVSKCPFCHIKGSPAENIENGVIRVEEDGEPVYKCALSQSSRWKVREVGENCSIPKLYSLGMSPCKCRDVPEGD